MGEPGPERNPWLDELDVELPPLEELAGRQRLTLRNHMIAALLHAGRPLDLEELVEVLEAAGVRAKSGDLALSIPRSWRGREPVWRDETGKFGVDVHSREMELFLYEIGVPTGPRMPLPLPPEPPEMPADDVPLTAEEFSVVMRNDQGHRLSRRDLFAALLESSRRSIPNREAEDIIRLMGLRIPRILAKVVRRTNTGPVSIDDDDVLHVDPAHRDMPGIRRKVRALAKDAIYAERMSEHVEVVDRIRRDARLVRHRKSQAKAMTARRAVVRALPEKSPVLFGRLDASMREIRTWPIDAVDGIAADLAGYDVLVGLGPRSVLERAGQDPTPFVLRDVSPPQKTMTITKGGRTLRLTPRMLITSSVRISRPLADARKVAKYVREGHEGRLRRRLESDLKTLYAFYRYGILHRAVRVRWGFLDELIPARWAEEGDASLLEMVMGAVEGGRRLEVVTGHAPSFTDPWARARPVTVIPPRMLRRPRLIDDRTGEEIWEGEVQAARLG